MGGTCTGEHGIGQKKIAYMEDEHGAPAVDLMRRVKAAFDPQNLFNPGKVFRVKGFPIAPHRGKTGWGRATFPRRSDEDRHSRVGFAGVGSPRSADAAREFAPNGPLLPIEFCRVSGDGRLTLVIDETFGAVCTTYSAPSADEPRRGDREPRIREGTRRAGVGFVELASGRQSDVAMQRHPHAVATIAAWAQANGYDAAIWTRSASNFASPTRAASRSPSPRRSAISKSWKREDAATFASALAYIRNAPPEVQTPVREEVDKRWPA